jgi:hypothetical protein
MHPSEEELTKLVNIVERNPNFNSSTPALELIEKFNRDIKFIKSQKEEGDPVLQQVDLVNEKLQSLARQEGKLSLNDFYEVYQDLARALSEKPIVSDPYKKSTQFGKTTLNMRPLRNTSLVAQIIDEENS